MHNMYMYIYIYTYMYICIHTYIHVGHTHKSESRTSGVRAGPWRGRVDPVAGGDASGGSDPYVMYIVLLLLL